MDLPETDVNPQPNGSPKKRPMITESNNGELSPPLAKRMRRVAELVLIMSGLSTMRGRGGNPTEEEVQLMTEARMKLADTIEEFKLNPCDLVGGKDAAQALIEDLGLRNEGFNSRFHHSAAAPPRLSISEKVLASKRKMELEESKKFAAPTGIRTLPTERPNPMPLFKAGFPTSTPPATTTPSSTGYLGKESTVRVERPQFKMAGVNYRPVAPPAWPAQPQAASSLKSRADNQNSLRVVGSVNLSKVGMSSQPSRDHNLKSVTTQTNTGTNQSLQGGMNFAQAPGDNIAKLVQKVLQPKLPQNPTWTPPSREYMNRPITCQTCGITINDVESVLICDACEKGFHMKCIPNLKGIPRGVEWHCMRCLSLNNGKPFHTKYGRVMRSTNALKVPSNNTTVQPPPDKKVEASDSKVNQHKVMSKESSGLQTTIGSDSNSNIADSSIVQGNDRTINGKDKNQPPSETHAHDSTQPLGPTSSSLIGSSSGISAELNQISESTAVGDIRPSENTQSIQIGVLNSAELKQEPDNSDIPPGTGDLTKPVQMNQISELTANKAFETKVQPPSTPTTPVVSKQPSENAQYTQTGLPNSAEVPDDNSDNLASKPDIVQEEHIAQGTPVETSEDIGEAEKHTLSDGPCKVEWIGDEFQVVDEKKIYRSCSIDGVTYKVSDHALFRLSHDKLIPFKLQGMWEDCKTSSKWVIVKRCYFPGDLPDSVAQPSKPENNEVYESINDCTLMADLIQCTCEVVPPSKFEEASEKQTQLGPESNQGGHPVFLCKERVPLGFSLTVNISVADGTTMKLKEVFSPSPVEHLHLDLD
ncbi:hypothetical protein ACFE04_023384 [Oxalis oulophora]